MPYSRDGIMAQIWVAFGQGTGTVRVSQEASLALRELYFGAITDEIVQGIWATAAVQVLERIRAIGRLAAQRAALRGDTAISADDVNAGAARVEKVSATPLCPPRRDGEPAV